MLFHLFVRGFSANFACSCERPNQAAQNHRYVGTVAKQDSPKGAHQKKEIVMKVSRDKVIAFAAAMAVTMLAVVSVPVVAHAQAVMKVTIPFDFYVGSQSFPAGDYQVQVSNAYVKVFDAKGHSSFALTTPVANRGAIGDGNGQLVFSRYDSYYFLSEVRRGGYSTAQGLTPSHLEVQTAKNSGEKQQLAFGLKQ